MVPIAISVLGILHEEPSLYRRYQSRARLIEEIYQKELLMRTLTVGRKVLQVQH